MIDIKAFRKDKKISQKIFCETVGISQSYVSKIENGIENLSDSAFRKIYEAYPDVDNYKAVPSETTIIDDKSLLIDLLEKYMKTSAKMEIKIESLLSELQEYRKKYGPL